MRCCVPSCKNDSKHISKSQGITFHVFPSEPNLRASWLKAVGKDSWSPRDRSTVCSEHFSPSDLYETKSGLKKVKTGAIPICTQVIHKNVNLFQVCRICLAVDLHLHPMSMCKLEKAYENLTGITLSNEDELPQKLCTECARRLLNSDKLRSRSLRANSLLQEIVKKQKIITVQSIAAINREDNHLASVLTKKLFEPEHYDSYIEYNEAQDEQTDKTPIQEIEDIKSEKNEEIFINEIYTESNNDVINENNDNDFVVTNYSSDDSLPLETQRKKVKKIKTKEKKRKKVEKIQNEPKIDRRRKPFLNDDLNETLFTITDLTFEEQVAEINKRRETSNYKNSMYKCTACFKGFLDETAYNGHMTRHTNQCGEYECDICKTHFKHPHALRKHITAHHTQRFSCNRCVYVTTHRQTARLHERWHKGTKYQCPHCQDEFVKFTTYMGHIRIKHPSDFVCGLCGYSFVSEKGIELHKKLKHRLHDGVIPDDGPLCELCNVRFVSQEAYRRHLHVSARHNSSDSDSKELNKSRKRTRAVREKKQDTENTDDDERKKLYPSQMRKAEGPIPCEQCGLQLEDSRAYHGHFRRMHPDKNRTNYPSMKSPCMCEVCGRMFQSYALLKDHRWTHTGERPFACDACGKRFRMRQRLVAHRRVHAPRRQYACALCGKAFSTHSNRQRHMFIHTGLKPFKCEMCGKCFKHASEKRAHITYVHLKKPWPKRARGKRRADRPGQLMGQDSLAGASEMDIPQPMWTNCDPKIGDINNIIDDKPIYYNLKI
ncbi:zinc finger protein 502-like [Melitaea cinxia]|uniref:zinc finger protein 502-like n=1 Tax=Melitaea cinxia TaxID=113334 RepID=UPI001E2710B9|nr:zinc finger protein 502-like [Melitaea cinxia]